MVKVGDTVRLTARGEVVAVIGQKAIVAWSKGSTSSIYTKSLEVIPAAIPYTEAKRSEPLPGSKS